jgi:tetratricopeptide (TPR) repeat protein
MATFYYNPYSGENYQSQWSNYKQKSSYTKDIVKSNNSAKVALYEQIESIQCIINESNNDVAEAINQSANAVCGTLEDGFSLITSQLQNLDYTLSDIRSELGNISEMLDWNFSIIIAEHRISNMLLGNIAELLRIPDIQKERQYYVEQGLKFFKNVVFDDDFFNEALSNLSKAEAIEPTDYFILHHIGLIYLNSIKHLDIPKAESYFSRAAKYSNAELNNNATITQDILRLNSNENYNNQFSIEPIKLQTAESYMYIGRCKYIQGDMEAAIEYCNKSYSMLPELLEAGYLKAKALSALGRMEESFQVLDIIVDTNRFYMTKILSDKDFVLKKETTQFLVKKKEEALKKADEKIDYCKSIMNPYSHAKDLMVSVNEYLNSNNYFAAMSALDLLG